MCVVNGILDFVGNGKHRIDLDADRELILVAIVNHTALRRDFECALLLAFGALLIIRGINHMKKIESGPDRHSPKPHDGNQKVNPPF